MRVEPFSSASTGCWNIEISPIRQCESGVAVVDFAEIELFRVLVSHNLIKPANELRQGDVKPIAPELNVTEELRIRVVEPFAGRPISRRT